MRRCYWVLLPVFLAAPLCLGQTNLLTNGNFEQPGPVAGCSSNDVTPVPSWTSSNGTTHRNDTLYIPSPCKSPGSGPDDTAHASMQGWGNGDLSWYQTVPVTASAVYTLTGYWWVGHMDTSGSNTATAEVRNGNLPSSPLIAQATVVRNQSGDFGAWLSFSANATTPAGCTQVTVVLRTVNSGSSTGFALHVDDVQLTQATCLLPPTIDSVSPAYGIRGTTVTGMTITGSNFTAGKTHVKLQQAGQTDIVATNVVVGAGGTSLTCNVTLPSTAMNRWDIVVSVDNSTPNQNNCAPAVLPAGFLVVLPALSNGSFELPTAAGACPVVTLNGFPTDWSAIEIAGYGGGSMLLRDSDVWRPTCPPPDALHYASSTSSDSGSSGSYAKIYQTIAATPGSQYVFSGYFAGGGTNQVDIQLLDGDISAGPMSATTVHLPGGAYDWTLASVVGAPTQPYLTVVWMITPKGGGPHGAHADALDLQVCNSPITVTGITPTYGTTGGTVHITNLAGTGFSGTPTVKLIKPGTTITATNVVVASPTQITCDFDLTGKPGGAYQVLVANGPCMGAYSSFVVVNETFTNGSFEQGDPANPSDMPGWGLLVDWPGMVIQKTASGAHGSLFGGIDTTWDGQFYAGGSVGSSDDPRVGLYQVFKTVPGSTYNVSGGWFGGIQDNAGLAWWEVLIVDGANVSVEEMNGLGGTPTQIVKHEHAAAAPALTFRETFSGQFTALSGATTVYLKWGYVSGGAYSILLAGWDNMVIASSCHPVPFDADGDEDVDQDDFGVLLRCFSGSSAYPTEVVINPGPPEVTYRCDCFDKAAPAGQIDQFDVTAFTNCAEVNGPMIKADPSNPLCQ